MSREEARRRSGTRERQMPRYLEIAQEVPRVTRTLDRSSPNQGYIAFARGAPVKGPRQLPQGKKRVDGHLGLQLAKAIKPYKNGEGNWAGNSRTKPAHRSVTCSRSQEELLTSWSQFLLHSVVSRDVSFGRSCFAGRKVRYFFVSMVTDAPGDKAKQKHNNSYVEADLEG